MELMNFEEYAGFETLVFNIKDEVDKKVDNLALGLLKGWIDYYTSELKEMKKFPEDVSEMGRNYIEAQIEDLKEKIQALKKSYRKMIE